jgi:4-diphosphocytidyl-2-C-methyl-D-erythritol kinase
LALAAAREFYLACPRVSGTGLHIHLDKRIPAGAGLGGGSSNAAGVLLALNALHGNPLSPEDLSALGVRLGADVPFFLFGKPAWATGIGERLEPVEQLPAMDLLIAYPEVSISTAEVFKRLNLGLTNPPKQHRNSPFKERLFCISRDLVNDLETVTLTRYPLVKSAKEALLSLGAKGALMSGSGSSVFGIFAHQQAVHEAAVALMATHGWQLFAVKLITGGHFMECVT